MQNSDLFRFLSLLALELENGTAIIGLSRRFWSQPNFRPNLSRGDAYAVFRTDD